MKMRKTMNQQVIPFPTLNKTPLKKDPERIIIFTTDDDQEFKIKAKYREVISDAAKALLRYYSEKS